MTGGGRSHRTVVAVLLAAALPLALSGCKKESAQAAADNPSDPASLTILAGSELRDIEPLLPEIERAAKVKLNFQYSGTLEGTERLLAGEAPDVAWFSHAKYLTLQQDLKGRVLSSEKTMLSPVVLGVKESLARQWGWDRNSVTWKDIAARAQSGQLKYGMTNPAASNSGFTALIGVTAALSGRGDAITTADVNAPAIQGFLKGQALTAGSSGFLGDAYIREQDRLGGLINYESVLLGLNAGGNLREKLTLIYPREGIVTADYPALLMTGAKREAYARLVDTLRSPEIQAKLTRETLRRPVTPGVKPDPRIPEALLVELPFPGQLDVLNAILTAYLDENRRPLNATFVLDVSGSMDGERLDALKTSLGNLAGGDTSLTGKFSRFSDREQVNLITFSSRVEDQRTFTLGSGQSADATRNDIRAYVNRLSPGGGTALYTALRAAYEGVRQQQAAQPDRSYSIVAMTDGEVNEGLDFAAFRRYYEALPAATKRVRVYPILFGDGDSQEMKDLAALTGGRTFDGRKNLASAFKDIRGYQ